MEHLGDLQHGVEPDEIGQLQRTHRMVHPQGHRDVDVLAGGEPVVVEADRRTDIRDHQPVHDEAGVVLGDHHGLAQPLTEPARERDGLRAGRQRRRQLHQLHHRWRIEEVDADHAVGTAGRRAQGRDRDRRRVGAEHDLRSDDPVERPERVELDRGVLGRRLDHEIDIGEGRQVGRPADPGQQGVAIIRGELVAFDGLGGGALDAGAPGRDQVLGRFDVDDVDAHTRGDLHDARAHQPAAHDPHGPNVPRFHGPLPVSDDLPVMSAPSLQSWPCTTGTRGAPG